MMRGLLLGAGITVAALLAFCATPTAGQCVAGSSPCPDAYGYVAVASVNGSPFYLWQDASTGGTDLNLADESSVPLPIPPGFDFKYYGTTRATANVVDNGFINFNTGNSYQPNPMVAAWPWDMIAPLWVDLEPQCQNPETPGRVYWQQMPTFSPDATTALVVQWDHVSMYNFGACTRPACIPATSTMRGSTFEVKLVEGTDVFEFHYKCAHTYDYTTAPSGGVAFCYPTSVGMHGGTSHGILISSVTTPGGACSGTGQFVNQAYRMFKNDAEPGTSGTPATSGTQSFAMSPHDDSTVPSLEITLDSDDPKKFLAFAAPPATCGSVADAPAVNTLYYKGNRKVTFTPAYGFLGTCSFSYRIDDGFEAVDITVVIDIAYPPLLCSLLTEGPIYTGHHATFKAEGGSGLYAWQAIAGAAVSDQSGQSFTATWSQPGNRVAKVTGGGQVTMCPVEVLELPPFGPVQCKATGEASTESDAFFVASAGDGDYAWFASGAIPEEGTTFGSQPFATRFPVGGIHWVVVHSDGTIGQCPITITQPCGALEAGFEASASQVGVGQVVTLVDQSTGEIRDWQWDFGDGGTSSEPNAMHAYAMPGTYLVRLTVTEVGSGCSSLFDTVLHVGTSAEEEVVLSAGIVQESYPTAFAGEDQEVLEGTNVNLSGLALDPVGLTFHWRLLQGPESIPIFHDGPDFSFMAPLLAAPEHAMEIVYELHTKRGRDFSLPSTVSIVVVASDLRPLAIAGDQLEAARASQVQLNGSASLDPEGTTLRYLWELVDGEEVSLAMADTAHPTFIVPPTGTMGYSDVRLTVDDGRWTSSDTVRVWFHAEAMEAPAAAEKAATPAATSLEATADPLLAIWPYLTLGTTIMALAILASVLRRHH